MEKQLAQYYGTTLRAVEALESSPSHKQAAQLYEFHTVRVRDFQHERLIHLIVTLFFGLLVIASFILFIVTVFASQGAFSLLTGLSAVLLTLLVITEIFYIRHYYQLENGTQRLYQLTERLEKLLTPITS